MMDNDTGIIANLFREEFSKMVAVISKRYGLQHIETAEDLVSETFATAAESWKEGGLPPNPTAWLYTVAKQKTIHYFRRNRILADKVIPQWESKLEMAEEMAEVNFSTQQIKDSQLQMLFVVCNPAIASEAQIGLALRILCGFSIEEIAEAFFTNKETINKRLFRARERLRAEKIKMEFPPNSEINTRLDNALHIIYLLFNEGYYSKTKNQILREELCHEALRLGVLLIENESTNTPKTNALMALMCFHASRFSTRQTSEEDFVLYEQQHACNWDKSLIRQGMYFLGRSAAGNEITSYHLEAKIASCHCTGTDTREKWEEVLQLYNQLLLINYSPAVALNRTYALYKADGRETALKEAKKLKLVNSHFYFALLGELYKGVDDKKAIENLRRAFSLAKTETERKIILKRMQT
ncbi:RNA polymerase sigma factor [Parapedobacter sp. ISTM3]|uniref:RNA polymerase sigma factor n=1 Tax=Parapedobacter sp. ISTM3 TaxID=2800130 RepID=UPI001F3A2512|nr:sigma-70 family RNA polymerase sigma factor [Parapedobacter sp. ISTM3]